MKIIKRFRFLAYFLEHLFISRDRILSARSSDGVNWKREKGVRKQSGGIHDTDMAYYCFAHQPDDFNGDWEIFYHSGSQESGNWITRIIRARSSDGLKWVDFEKPSIQGPIDDIAYDQIRAPYLFKTGKFWRLYFSARGKDQRTRILSAHSLDREFWRIDQAPCIDAEACVNLHDKKNGVVTDVTDPCIIQTEDGNKRMYFSTLHGSMLKQNIASAISEDGIRWRIESGFRLQPGENDALNCMCNPCVIRMDEGWRMYFRGAEIYPLWNNIYSARSKDGLHWEQIEVNLEYQRWNINERNAVAFPFVTRLGNQDFRMYYTGYWGTLFDQTNINRYTI